MNVNAQIQQDKVKHFIAGNLITANTTLIAYKITKNKNKALLIGFGAGVLAGATKELYDSTGRGCCDFKDFAWTCIGSSVSTVVFTITIK
jgi:uncharacterized protein YfiM (DUF2279 family)